MGAFVLNGFLVLLRLVSAKIGLRRSLETGLEEKRAFAQRESKLDHCVPGSQYGQ